MYICIYIYIHTHTHTHIYIYRDNRGSRGSRGNRGTTNITTTGGGVKSAFQFWDISTELCINWFSGNGAMY